jgi:hypothetical protein
VDGSIWVPDLKLASTSGKEETNLRRRLTMALGVALGANGALMLVMPLSWYGWIPGVADTGPANPHFIRDIGCAYLVSGLSVIWLAQAPFRAWPAALVGGTFLGLHALVHLYDFFTGHESARNFMGDLPLVFLPAVLVIRLSWRGRREANGETK